MTGLKDDLCTQTSFENVDQVRFIYHSSLLSRQVSTRWGFSPWHVSFDAFVLHIKLIKRSISGVCTEWFSRIGGEKYLSLIPGRRNLDFALKMISVFIQ
jgi:hypothetical protein